jgi:hypothetical protein
MCMLQLQEATGEHWTQSLGMRPILTPKWYWKEYSVSVYTGCVQNLQNLTAGICIYFKTLDR